MADFVYESPPLVEVIAEVHWRIERLATVPDGGIDPHFNVLVANLEQALPQSGFPVVERLVPSQLPIELLADKPVVRFWRGEKQYPLVQLGPGLMTINIVPPYEGWRAFKPTLVKALDLLRTQYPMSDTFLKIERAELRYIDGFTGRHGFASYPQFVRENLALGYSLPDEVLNSATEPAQEHVMWSADFGFPLNGRPNQSGIVRLRPGKIRDEPGAILECAVRWRDPTSGIRLTDLPVWFDMAHGDVSRWFFALVKERLVESFGSQRELKP
jgi:uncharacterized protein (TIGR04255 family)